MWGWITSIKHLWCQDMFYGQNEPNRNTKMKWSGSYCLGIVVWLYTNLQEVQYIMFTLCFNKYDSILLKNVQSQNYIYWCDHFSCSFRYHVHLCINFSSTCPYAWKAAWKFPCSIVQRGAPKNGVHVLVALFHEQMHDFRVF